MRKRPMRGGGDDRAASLRPSSDPVPASTTEVSSPRVRVPEVVPTAWLDRLLVAVIDLPLPGGERAVVEAILDSVSAILPTYAVGASVGTRDGDGREERLIIR